MTTPHNPHTLLLLCKKSQDVEFPLPAWNLLLAFSIYDWLNKKDNSGLYFFIRCQNCTAWWGVYHTLFQWINCTVDLLFLDIIRQRSSKSAKTKAVNLWLAQVLPETQSIEWEEDLAPWTYTKTFYKINRKLFRFSFPRSDFFITTFLLSFSLHHVFINCLS